MIFFFAYVSFFNRQDLKSTRLGKMTLLLVTLFYFSRAIEEFILFDLNVGILVACCITALIYFLPLVLVHNRGVN